MTQTMDKILSERVSLEETLIETEGEITEELERLWNQNDIDLKRKVDSYGFVLDELSNALKNIKAKKKDRDEKVKKAVARIEREVDRIKARLNYFCNGQPLRGNEYSFHPYNSVEREINPLKITEDDKMKYCRVNVELSYGLWFMIKNHLSISENSYIEKLKVLQSDFPADHQAIEADIRPSVRMN